MKNIIKTAGLAAFALAFAGSALAQNDIAGTWKSQFDSQIGIQRYTFTFKRDGTNLLGKAVSERQDATNDVAITNGAIAGDKISFSEPLKIQDNDVVVEYSGTIAGDELKLHRKVGDFAEYDIVAKRVMAGDTGAGATSAPASVAGKWQGQFDSQIGVQKYTYEFKVAGTNLTGQAIGISDNGTNQTAITNGTVSANGITFVEPLKFGDNDISIEYTGKLSGDEIKLHRKVGDFAEEDMTVKRVSETGAKPEAKP
jgi:hypothetical protein